jgi:hypothetical protein
VTGFWNRARPCGRSRRRRRRCGSSGWTRTCRTSWIGGRDPCRNGEVPLVGRMGCLAGGDRHRLDRLAVLHRGRRLTVEVDDDLFPFSVPADGEPAGGDGISSARALALTGFSSTEVAAIRARSSGSGLGSAPSRPGSSGNSSSSPGAPSASRAAASASRSNRLASRSTGAGLAEQPRVLLGDVGQFVREQPPTGRGVRRVAPDVEGDVLADRVRGRAHFAGGSGRLGVGVDAYPAEVVPHPRAHQGLDRGSSDVPGREMTAATRGGTKRDGAWPALGISGAAVL